MSPRRALALTLLAISLSGAVAWVRPQGYDAPAWSFLLLVGVIGIASGAWSALFLPLAAIELRWRGAQVASGLLPAFAVAIPAEWMLKMVVRGQLASAPTAEILASSRVEVLLYAVLLVAGVVAWSIHIYRATADMRRVLWWSPTLLFLVPISVWATRLGLPMLIGIATQILVGFAFILEALRPPTRQRLPTAPGDTIEPPA
ncbi:MAG: hypothetical protein WDA16_00095 [Candidatus Thermoplasmatota archaeon]